MPDIDNTPHITAVAVANESLSIRSKGAVEHKKKAARKTVTLSLSPCTKPKEGI